MSFGSIGIIDRPSTNHVVNNMQCAWMMVELGGYSFSHTCLTGEENVGTFEVSLVL